ncbi:MAG TPA: sugar O-acetyltransferase [Herpetosiphonaceae bacterium]|nr:sugar O-acetyltransferase [Herpetosiphonaceae bacterium]
MTVKTEREKMLAGELYVADDPELFALSQRGRRYMQRFNQASYDQPDEKRAILAEWLGAVGASVWIEGPFFCDYGAHLFLGDHVYFNTGCVVLDSAAVRVGNNVMFGPSVQIYTATHPVLARERIKGPELAYPISIGDNVWVGGGAIICPGVTIGANTTIGAGSVVTKDIPANVAAAGNPCRVIRELPDE